MNTSVDTVQISKVASAVSRTQPGSTPNHTAAATAAMNISTMMPAALTTTRWPRRSKVLAADAST